MDKPKQKIKCAIYTRKSHEEGLDKEFNTLDAQRESCEAYIKSQQHEGWIGNVEKYDDGGFSGGNIERPGLQQLMRDIKYGKVDAIVCYKIDRLSRSLSDFIKMMDVFDEYKVSFVSVTQSFDTSTAMGRLTLNILLSFAAFEREITGERIRDKILASKKKGMWMGGRPPLGYDIDNRRLVKNTKESKLIRTIFKRFVSLGSAIELAKELNAKKQTTKSWTTVNGNHKLGRPFDKSIIYKILRNRVYLGEIPHKGEFYLGEHPALVTDKLWNQVGSILDSNATKRGNQTRAQTPALLKGLLFDEENNALAPTFANRHGKRYRYYTSTKAIKNGYDESPLKNMSASELEEIVLYQVKELFGAPEWIVKVWFDAKKESKKNIDEEFVRKAMHRFHPIWDQLFPAEQTRILQFWTLD